MNKVKLPNLIENKVQIKGIRINFLEYNIFNKSTQEKELIIENQDFNVENNNLLIDFAKLGIDDANVISFLEIVYVHNGKIFKEIIKNEEMGSKTSYSYIDNSNLSYIFSKE